MAWESSWGTTPHNQDTLNTLLKRIASSASGGSGGGSGGGGTGTGQSGMVGVVDPEGVATATPGTSYLNTATNQFWIKHSGSGNTGWNPALV